MHRQYDAGQFRPTLRAWNYQCRTRAANPAGVILAPMVATNYKSLPISASVIHLLWIVTWASIAGRVRSCSSVERNTRPTNFSSPCSRGRFSMHELSKASSVGMPSAGVTARTARSRKRIALLSCCEGSGIRSAARHGAPGFASDNKGPIHSGAYARASVNACTQPVRMVSSSSSSERAAGASDWKFDGAESALPART